MKFRIDSRNAWWPANREWQFIEFLGDFAKVLVMVILTVALIIIATPFCIPIDFVRMVKFVALKPGKIASESDTYRHSTVMLMIRLTKRGFRFRFWTEWVFRPIYRHAIYRIVKTLRKQNRITAPNK